MQHFFVYGVLPEIIGEWYTQKPVANNEGVVVEISQSIDEIETDNEDYEKMWCIAIHPVMDK